jgi:large subunit ribosomal protein L25
MVEINLKAEAGRTTGSRAASRLRAAGRVPGVVYGHGTTPLPVSVDGRALRSALTTDAGQNAVLSLQVDGQTHLTMAREVQRHPVRHTVLHVDFQIVRRDEVISADVPVTLVGEAHDVAINEGLVEQPLMSLAVQAVPGLIPNAIEIDVSGLSIGDRIRVSDISLPDGVTTEVDPEEVVVLAQGSAVAAELAAEEEAAAAEREEVAAASTEEEPSAPPGERTEE